MEINANDELKAGEVRIATDADFVYLKDLCENHTNWYKEYNKKPITVWTKSNTISEFKMIKVSIVLTI